MEISAKGLQLNLRALRRADDEEWTRVMVLVKVPGFLGEFEAWLQTSDITRFADACNALYKNVGKQGDATLQCAEPGISLKLESNSLGGIAGRYALESERPVGIPTLLSGSFQLDQSYLPALEKSARQLAAELSGLPKAT
ncbi:MAG TPA: hypothetical protein VME42_17630 [Steroidobacteraceae bacterium]|nr:hypothetical protein [Steroidobacteraceae bacterium]